MTPVEMRTMRLAAGLTQTKAAELCGVSLRAWQHYELGDRKIPEPVARLLTLATKDKK